MRGLTGKRILRDAARDLVPSGILRRPKKGFGMPVAAWLNGPLRPLLNDLLGAEALKAGGIFEPREVRRLIDLHAQRRQDLRKPLWTLLVFELWRRSVLERRVAPSETGRVA
jgi:asparagine synthase (glutamine-hydrolysing)